jgi:hypothetical protein
MSSRRSTRSTSHGYVRLFVRVSCPGSRLYERAPQRLLLGKSASKDAENLMISKIREGKAGARSRDRAGFPNAAVQSAAPYSRRSWRACLPTWTDLPRPTSSFKRFHRLLPPPEPSLLRRTAATRAQFVKASPEGAVVPFEFSVNVLTMVGVCLRRRGGAIS